MKESDYIAIRKLTMIDSAMKNLVEAMSYEDKNRNVQLAYKILLDEYELIRKNVRIDEYEH